MKEKKKGLTDCTLFPHPPLNPSFGLFSITLYSSLVSCTIFSSLPNIRCTLCTLSSSLYSMQRILIPDLFSFSAALYSLFVFIIFVSSQKAPFRRQFSLICATAGHVYTYLPTYIGIARHALLYLSSPADAIYVCHETGKESKTKEPPPKKKSSLSSR